MIGKEELIIDIRDFANRGMSTNSEIADAGFSSQTDAVNLLAVPGVAYAPAEAVDSDTDTRLTGNIIAMSTDMNVISANNALAVSDDGKGYRYNGAKLTAAGIALTAGQTWAAGFTDIVTFGGEAYVSSKESLTRWDNSNNIDAGGSWPYSFTTANVPHPGLVYENNMYWADKNLLKSQSTIGDAVAPATVLTLDSSSVIMALGVDPGSGLMLISTINTLDISGTIPAVNKLLWYDGNSLKVSKSVIIEDTIYGFHTVGGTTFVGYGKNLGYINGSGIAFLRNLKNVTNTSTELPYKHHFAHIGNTLYVLDGLQILAFGEVTRGRKIFYYCFKNNTNSNKILALGAGGGGKLIYSFTTSKFYSVDTSSVATTNTMDLYTNKYYFPRPVYLRSVYLEYYDAIVNNDNNRALSFRTERTPSYSGLAVQGGTSLRNTSGASVYFIGNVIGFDNNKVNTVQFLYESSSANNGLKRIIVYYDPAE